MNYQYEVLQKLERIVNLLEYQYNVDRDPKDCEDVFKFIHNMPSEYEPSNSNDK